MTKAEFIAQSGVAIDAALARGAQFNKTVALAQAALESNWGNSELAQRGNNLFAIKSGSTWQGEIIRLPGWEWSPRSGWYQSMIAWRKYRDWAECVLDYGRIIGGFSWYQDAREHRDDAGLFLKSLLPSDSEPGWATDPGYVGKIMRIAAEIEALGGPKWQEKATGE